MDQVKHIDPLDLSVPQLHGLLLSAIAPRPIAFASTIDREGRVNLSPFSFFNVFSSNPPTLIFSPARSGRNNSTKHTYQNVKEVAEVAISVINYEIVEQMSLASTAYDKGINEFVKAGFTEMKSERIRPPWVAESPVSFECKVDRVIELGTSGGAGNLIICTVLLVHLHEKYLTDDQLDTRKLDLVGRMGASWYCRASGSALFEIPKPLATKGIGIDQLPDHIKNSEILSANNLGRLGNIERLPSPSEIEHLKQSPAVQKIIQSTESQDERMEAIQYLAKAYLETRKVKEALMLLMMDL